MIWKNQGQGFPLNSKKLPAVTMVAAWSKADTGVGAPIASVNQPENPHWADLVRAGIIKEYRVRSKIWIETGGINVSL